MTDHKDFILELGIDIPMLDVPGYPEYAQLRDDLCAAPRLLRWLSWRRRRRLRELKLRVMDAVLETGGEA